jgi:hypothetical protein
VKSGAAEQTDAADEAGASDGASPLISVLGRQQMMERVAMLVSLGLALGACDTMIADRMIIRTPSERAAAPPSTAELLTTSRDALADCRFADADITSLGDTLHWSNPKRPPGLHIMVHRTGDDVRVTLAQDLYGPIGPTDAYRCVRKTLRRRLEKRFGKDRVRLKS